MRFHIKTRNFLTASKRFNVAAFVFISITGFSTLALAQPILQVGAPGGFGEGTYADYIVSLTNPTESDTAVTSGPSLFAAGKYGPNTIDLGGQSSDPSGLNWTGVNSGFDSSFNSADAVIMATVPDGSLVSGSLTLGGNPAFYSTGGFESGFVMPNPPSNHAPVQTGDYLFFDIGNFANNSGVVPDFAVESGSGDGEVKTVTFSTSGFSWIHFDLFALETRATGPPSNPNITTLLQGNPGSHDVIWKGDGNGDNGGNGKVPEPSTWLLLGSGLIGIALLRKKLMK